MYFIRNDTVCEVYKEYKNDHINFKTDNFVLNYEADKIQVGLWTYQPEDSTITIIDTTHFDLRNFKIISISDSLLTLKVIKQHVNLYLYFYTSAYKPTGFYCPKTITKANHKIQITFPSEPFYQIIKIDTNINFEAYSYSYSYRSPQGFYQFAIIILDINKAKILYNDPMAKIQQNNLSLYNLKLTSQEPVKLNNYDFIKQTLNYDFIKQNSQTDLKENIKNNTFYNYVLIHDDIGVILFITSPSVPNSNAQTEYFLNSFKIE